MRSRSMTRAASGTVGVCALVSRTMRDTRATDAGARLPARRRSARRALCSSLSSARELLVAAENGSPNIAFERGALIKGWSVGTALVEGERARVPVATTPSRKLELVVVKEDGQWRISMMETLRGMLGSPAPKAPQ